MNNYLAVALGGAIGSMGRYWMTLALSRNPPHWMPLATLSVNVVGSLLIGIVWAYLQQRSQNELLRLLVSVGLLGGFTTFSTFSLETIHMLGAGQTGHALLNIGFNVIVCLLAVALGLALGRWLF
jgi:CrcB protein